MFYFPPGVYPEGDEFLKTPEQTDINNPNITCGRAAFDSAPSTETADVSAGSEVGFRVSWDGSGKYGVFYHPGPAQIYLSRAPNDNLKNYRGDGDWFKIAYGGPVGNNEWLLWGAHEVSVRFILSSRSVIFCKVPNNRPNSLTLQSH